MRESRRMRLSLTVGVFLCLGPISETTRAESTSRPAEPFYPPAGLDMGAADPTTRPGDNFFQYANGAWLARTAIPPDKPFMTEAQASRDRIELQLRQLMGSAAAHAGHEPADVEGKVGAFYAAFLKEEQRETLGSSPLLPDLDAIRHSHSRRDLARLMGQSPYAFVGTFFQFQIDVDLKNTERYAIYLQQGGLTMPDRDYYLLPQLADKKARLHAYAAQLLTLLNWPEAGKRADEIVALETHIAQVSWTKAQQRDLQKIYNPFTVAELQAFAPGMPWRDFLDGARLPDIKRVVIAEKTAFPKIARIFQQTPPETLQAWAAFTSVDAASPYLSAAFAQAHFEFHQQTLLGVKERPARWKEAIAAVSGGDCDSAGEKNVCFGTLNWAVGQLYAARHFPPTAKASARALAAAVQQAYRERVERLDWMSAATRAEAMRKLDTYVIKVGYPDRPRDYSRVVIRDDDLVGNVRRAADADWAFYVDRSNGPVDKTDWTMTPQTFDAYNGSLRDIVFPAAILQPPDFDPAADAAVNFGCSGSTIGHELTHGFDDQGRLLDTSGALRNWWTDSDDQAFRQRAAVLGAQYATYEPLPGLHINPDLTMGENIADLGGVLIALDAYHESLHGAAAPVIDGLSGDQRFFRAYAQCWRGKGTEDYIRNLTTSDPHSFRLFRVNGVVRNVDAWYSAFGVQEHDQLFLEPALRARIW
jgi:putative endopeptidase